MSPAAPTRLRVPLTPPQAVTNTSAMLWSPQADSGRVGLVLAHGAGSDLTTPVLLSVSRALAASGYPALTFNFGYAEAGRKAPDPPARLRSAFKDAVTAASQAMDGRPLVLGGRSMGGRVASLLAAEGAPCAGLVFLGYPLHAARRPERLRTDHWEHLAVPILFVQGDRDRLCDLDLLNRERAARLSTTSSSLHVVAGADHSFALRKSDGRSASSVLDEIAGVVAEWLDGLTVPAPA